MIFRKDEDGILIFDKKSGYNILLDECKPKTKDIAPRHISIALTNRCNFYCGHCYVSHGYDDLNIENIKQWINELECNGCLSIGLGGGEPTLWPELINLVQYINKTQMAVTLTTNGSASVELYFELMEYINLLRFSLDGLDDVYESYRPYSFNDIITKINVLKKSGKIGINYLVTDKTVNQLYDLDKYIDQIDPSEILLLPCIINRRIILSENAQLNLNKWINEHINKLSISLSYLSKNIVSADFLPIQNFSSNMQNKYFMHVNSKGELMNDVFDSNPLRVGNSIIQTIQQKRN